MPVKKKIDDKKSCDKGVSVPESPQLPLQEELKNVISLMGPNTPHIRSTDSESTPCNAIEEIYDNKIKCIEEDNHDEKEDTAPSTPKDYSELSSFPTDSVDVYVQPKFSNYCKPHAFNVEHVSRKCSYHRPIDKLSNFLGLKCKESKEPLDLYRINVLQKKDDSSPPQRVVFDLVDELPRPCQVHAATSTSLLSKRDAGCCCSHPNEARTNATTSMHCPAGMIVAHQVSQATGMSQKATFYKSSVLREPQLRPLITGKRQNLKDLTRVDVYYFDHGNSAYYHTTDSPPIIMTEIVAEKTELYTTKFWAEVFGTVHIGFSFLTSFVLQFVRFVFQSLVRPLTVGLIQLASDYCFKPLLATLFNAVLQPPLIFLYNVCTSVRDICDPVAEGLGYFLREVAVLFRAIRFVEIRTQQPRLNCVQRVRRGCQTEACEDN